MKYQFPNSIPALDEDNQSDHLLCYVKNNKIPFVGWYDANTQEWNVSHFSSYYQTNEVVFTE